MRGLLLLPNNEWGQRIFKAFDTELKTLGGSIAGDALLRSGSRDYSQPITQLLLIDESRARCQHAERDDRYASGIRAAEPRRRAVRLRRRAAVQGRSLRPALRFHLARICRSTRPPTSSSPTRKRTAIWKA
jgi:outer membrane PBP1 activator LpoA protein